MARARGGSGEAAKLRRQVAALEREREQLFARLTAVERERAGLADTLPIAAHQLLSPVQALLLWSDALATRARGDDAPATTWLLEHAAKMRRQLERVDALMRAAIEICRSQLEDSDRPRVTCDLVASVHAVVASHADEAAQAGCDLRVDAPPSVVGAWDANKLRFILAGLVSNAVRHAPGAPIRIEVVDGGTRATVRVCDGGPGFAAEDAERLFQPFARAGTTTVEGFGLGLWIVRELTRALGGRVSAEGRPGGGAVFTVVLRKSAHVASTRRARRGTRRRASSKELRP